jgi:hypothetical protein
VTYALHARSLRFTLPCRYDPALPSPRRDSIKKKLVEFERSFGLLLNKLGNFESDTIISMFNTQMQSESVWKASVTHATERLATLNKQYQTLQSELIMLREKGYTLQSEDQDEEPCAFGGSQLLKQRKPALSPTPSSGSPDADASPHADTALSEAKPEDESDADVDLLQFKPINTSTVEIAVKKANVKSDKLIETERVLAVLRMGVCALIERLAGVNMIPPELRDLFQRGPPSIDISDDNCCSALHMFTRTIESVLDSLDDTISPLGRSPLGRSPARRSPSNRSPAPSDRRGSLMPNLATRSGSISQGGFNVDLSGMDSPGKLNRRFSLSSR